MGINPDWEKRGTISITNASSTAGLQVKLTLDYVTGMNADFSDILFTTTAGVNIPYWVESYTASTSAVVWLKLPASVSQIYIYFGNTGATSASSGVDTFELFDNFASSLDTNKWTAGSFVYENNGAYAGLSTGYNTPDTNSGALRFSGTRSSTDTATEDGVSSTGFWGRSIRSHNGISLTDFIIEASINFTQSSTGTHQNQFYSAALGVAQDKDNYIYGMLVNDGHINFQREISGSVAEMASTQATYTASTYRRYKFSFHDGTYCYYDVAGTSGSREMWQSITSRYVLLGFMHRAPSASVTQLVDWVFVRKYVSSEPTMAVSSTGDNPDYSGAITQGTTTLAGAAVTLKETPATIGAGILATPGADVKEGQFATTNLITQAAGETHDTKIQAATGLIVQPQVSPRRDFISISTGLISNPVYNFLDYQHIATQLKTAATESDEKKETLGAYNVGVVEVSKSITDAMWQLSAEFIGDEVPPSFTRLNHEARDHLGVSQHLFTGISPTDDITLGYNEKKTKITGYDYGWYLSAQYIPDDARTMEVSTAHWAYHTRDWDDWIKYLLQGTGITAYRIDYGPSVDWKQFVFSNKTTKKEAIDTVSKYCNYIFDVQWRDYGTSSNPDWRPVAYWISQDNIDSSTAGLDLPAPITISWPSPYLVDMPKITYNPEEKVNRVRIIGSDPDGDIYQATAQTSTVTAGTEIAREYLEETSTYTTQSAVNNYAASMLSYFQRPGVTVTMRVLRRFDLKLYQRFKFGTGFPQELYGLTDGRDNINYLRITAIKYHTGPSELDNYVDVTAVYDHPFVLLKQRHKHLHPTWHSETREVVRKGIDEEHHCMRGTIESIADDGNSAVMVNEFGSRINVRIR